jgi:hypothetical protein
VVSKKIVEGVQEQGAIKCCQAIGCVSVEFKTNFSETISVSVRFQVLAAASMKFRVFWHVAPCNQVEVDRRFRALMMDAVGASETLVNFNLTTRRYIPEDSKLLVLSPS